MARRQRFAVAWVAVMANVGVIAATSPHHQVAVGLLVGVSCVIVGWCL